MFSVASTCCYLNYVTKYQRLNAVSFFETLGRTHIKRHKTNKQAKNSPGYFYIIKRTLSWNYLPKSLFQLKISPRILKSVSLGTHPPTLRVTIFTSALAMTLRIGPRAEMWFSSPGEYAPGEELFPPSKSIRWQKKEARTAALTLERPETES